MVPEPQPRVLLYYRRSVTDGLLGLHVPERCVVCSASGSVNLETTLRAGDAYLTWCSGVCHHESPVTPDEVNLRNADGAHATAQESAIRSKDAIASSIFRPFQRRAIATLV